MIDCRAKCTATLTWSFHVGFSGIEYRSLKALDKLSQPLPPSRKKWQSIALVPLCAKNNFPSSYKTCPLETKTGNFLNFLCFDRTTCRSIWWLWCQILFRSCHLRNGNAPSSLEKWSSKKFIELLPLFQKLFWFPKLPNSTTECRCQSKQTFHGKTAALSFRPSYTKNVMATTHPSTMSLC